MLLCCVVHSGDHQSHCSALKEACSSPTTAVQFLKFHSTHTLRNALGSSREKEKALKKSERRRWTVVVKEKRKEKHNNGITNQLITDRCKQGVPSWTGDNQHSLDQRGQWDQEVRPLDRKEMRDGHAVSPTWGWSNSYCWSRLEEHHQWRKRVTPLPCDT